MDLQWLSTCGRPWAETRAQQAMAITSLAHSGEISMQEFQALMQDLAYSDELNREADDMDVKNALVACIMIGAKLS